MIKAAGHGAIAALTGLLLSTGSARAADLGGNCCADLEERVAELEATTARKGTRQVSLTISGQVTRSILYWREDGQGAVRAGDSNTYAGLDQHPQSSRFTLAGTGKITPNLKAGFEFMIEWAGAGRTSTVDQLTPDQFSTATTIAAGTDGTLGVRTANWYLDHTQLGRVTVGRLNLGGPVATIDLGGISTVASGSPSLVGGGFVVAGALTTGTRLSAVVGPSYGGDRGEGIRYDSPSIGGFVVQASWAEDDIWTASLRYAGEFSGFRIAAGIGYLAQSDTASAVTNPVQLDTGARNVDNEWAASAAVMHVPSGLFAQGHYAKSEFLNDRDARFWLVQGGISKNWFGFGNTSLYGEYGKATDFISSGPANSSLYTNPTVAGIFATADSDVKFYGLGIVQQIDSAAMELFLGWRRFDVEVSGLGAGITGFANGSGELDLVTGGARIKF